jgi:hypothetical protein
LRVDTQLIGHGRTEAVPICSGSTAGNSMNDLVWAVDSLYADEIRPFGRILRKRLAELATAAGSHGAAEMDVRQLRALCEACPSLYITTEDGGEWSALLRGRQMTFVDAYSPVDVYPAELWQAAAAYFTSLEGDALVLPGGRYSCAQALVARCLPFLQGRSLGQVSHIVQLAISQKKLLGYLNGAVVPYGRSQSMLKEQCAKRQRPCASAARGGSGLATLEMVHTLIQEILLNLPPTGAIPLSNIKRLIRSRFHVELSETALGYAKLSELLQDPCLRDICTVKLQGHGYVICPRATSTQPCNISLFDTLCPTVTNQIVPIALNQVAAFASTSGCVTTTAFQPCMEQFAFTDAGVTTTAFQPCMEQFAQPVAAAYVSAPGTTTQEFRGVAPRVTPLCLEECNAVSPTYHPVACTTLSPTSLNHVRSKSDTFGQLPRLLGSPDNNGAHMQSYSFKAPTGLQLQPTMGGDVDVALDDFDTPNCKADLALLGSTGCNLEQAVGMPPPLLTPSTASMLSVQNTFLHFKPLASPSTAGACRRSRSQ